MRNQWEVWWDDLYAMTKSSTQRIRIMSLAEVIYFTYYTRGKTTMEAFNETCGEG